MVQGVRSSKHLSLVGSYCLLSCHHDDVMMIDIMIPYMYQLMFSKKTTRTGNWYHLYSDSDHYKHCRPLIQEATRVTVQGSST